MKSENSLILASTSAYRRVLLTRLGLPFTCVPPKVDETPRCGEPAADLVKRLARDKAQQVARSCTDAWVIGSDQVALLDDQIMGKPGGYEHCVEQLSLASGQVVKFLTAVAIAREPGSTLMEFVDLTTVEFRTLDAPSIARYVNLERPFDCAGGFKSEGLGIALFESIRTDDPTALIGLPLIRTAALLRSAGFQIP